MREGIGIKVNWLNSAGSPDKKLLALTLINDGDSYLDNPTIQFKSKLQKAKYKSSESTLIAQTPDGVVSFKMSDVSPYIVNTDPSKLIVDKGGVIILLIEVEIDNPQDDSNTLLGDFKINDEEVQVIRHC